MASLEIVALDAVTPQLRAAPAGDTYASPQTILMADAKAYGFASGDVALERVAAKVAKITDGAAGPGSLSLPTFAVAGLPTAATAGAGARATVSDASAAPVFNAAAVGGGTTVAPVFCTGAAWLYG